MSLGEIASIIGAVTIVATVIGGVLLKAYIAPIKNSTDRNNKVIEDHENRIRTTEGIVNTHSVHMENILKAIDRLVTKIDLLVTQDLRHHNRED